MDTIYLIVDKTFTVLFAFRYFLQLPTKGGGGIRCNGAILPVYELP